MLKRSLDGFFDQVEDFIENSLHKSAENALTRSSFPDVKLTNEYVCIPIYGVRLFSRTHQREFKKQFPDIELPEESATTNTYWVIIPRAKSFEDYNDDETASASNSGKRGKK